MKYTQHSPHTRTRRHILTASIGVLIIAVLAVGGLVAWQTYSASKTTTIGKTTLDFRVLLPNHKTVASVNGQALTPPKGAAYFVYTDTINKVAIKVTEQPLPASFKKNTDSQVAQVAKSYNATDNVSAGSTKVYIGTNVNGPQSVILTKQNLLILIKSQATITDKAWVNYISSLR